MTFNKEKTFNNFKKLIGKTLDGSSYWDILENCYNEKPYSILSNISSYVDDELIFSFEENIGKLKQEEKYQYLVKIQHIFKNGYNIKVLDVEMQEITNEIWSYL